MAFGKSKKNIYLDYAAATPLDPRVFSVMKPYLQTLFANPSAAYAPAIAIREAIEKARHRVADFLRTEPDTVIFTRGGTESCNMAIFGVIDALKATHETMHVITSMIEHDAVREPMRQLEEQGIAVTYVPADEYGRVSVEDIKKALRKDTALVSIMYANNETGTIQPVAEIGRELLRWRKEQGTSFPYFHTDACQATQFLPMSVEALHVDFLSFNGSKMYGPKGAGVLYRSRSVPCAPIIFGGGQEFGMRSGTEDVASIVGLGEAIPILEHAQNAGVSLQTVRNYLWEKIQQDIPDSILNGPLLHAEERLPNNLNVSFAGCDAEALVLYLDAAGIFVSSGSACAAEREGGSHVLRACGYAEDRVLSSIRFTLGRETAKKDIDHVMDELPRIVSQVRSMNLTGSKQ